MAESKVMTAGEAISRFVADGDIAYVGYNIAPYALCHEVIRQRKRNLDIVGASQVMQAAYMFTEGCANRTRTAYIGGVLAGRTRSKVMADLLASGALQYEEYSNQSMALMFMAGALGIPYIPTRSLLGSDFLSEECINHPRGFLKEKKYTTGECPFSGDKVVLLPALKPDVALMAAPRADEEGNVQIWGTVGDAKWAMWASVSQR